MCSGGAGGRRGGRQVFWGGWRGPGDLVRAGMGIDANDGVLALTEKEKQTLRLMVRGHDAKSIARSLDLSVHTINERLREARRKLAVSSSREAARLLLEVEGAAPQSLGDSEIGADAAAATVERGDAPADGAVRASRSPWIIGGLTMTMLLGLLALAGFPTAEAPPQAAATAEAPNMQVVEAARQWLMLLDDSRWDESYRGTGTAFRKMNTLAMWTAASEQARVPLGAMKTRDLLRQEYLPAPPDGYEVVKFRTRFANKAEAVETVTMTREDGAWRVVGVTVG